VESGKKKAGVWFDEETLAVRESGNGGKQANKNVGERRLDFSLILILSLFFFIFSCF
jgi:hypothetical protein